MRNNTYQEQIYDYVVRRGFGPKEQELTDDQFTLRQIAKTASEIPEALAHIHIPGAIAHSKSARTIHKLLEMREDLDLLFKDKSFWRQVEIDDFIEFLKELADVYVPGFCAAASQDVNLAALCVDKARMDITRGNGEITNVTR